MKITTRPATIHDKSFAREAHHLAYRDVVVRQFGPWNETVQDQFFENKWAHARFAILLVDGEPCGVADVENQTEKILIHELVIHTHFQEKGIGTVFLQQVIERAKALNVPVRLQVLLKNRAIALYQRLGFREFDSTETHILMEWNEHYAPSQYTFTDYSPDWPLEFNREAEGLKALLGDTLLAVHHVGSTSVPGLAAKPVIDLLPVVLNITSIDARTYRMVDAGYVTWGECGLPGRRLFTKDRGEYRTHNIHIYQADHPDVERHLAFCAYLKNHAAACREYEALKRKVYAQHPADIAAYRDGKDAWIKQLEPISLTWYRQRTC